MASQKREAKNVPEWKYKKNLKAVHMWIEQLLLRVSRLETELEEIKETVKLIKERLNNINGDKIATN